MNQPWQDCLIQKLSADGGGRLAVLGIGHELCGDDAVGTRIASMLRARLPNDPRLLALETGPAPENFTGVLRRFQPDLILMIDAAGMDETPGTVRFLDGEALDGLSASTHTLPLELLTSFLKTELGCAVSLLGIQPEQTFADQPLRPSVQRAAEEILEVFVQWLKSESHSSGNN